MDASADLLKVNHRLESRVPEIGLLGSEGGATSSVVPTPIFGSASSGQKRIRFEVSPTRSRGCGTHAPTPTPFLVAATSRQQKCSLERVTGRLVVLRGSSRRFSKKCPEFLRFDDDEPLPE